MVVKYLSLSFLFFFSVFLTLVIFFSSEQEIFCPFICLFLSRVFFYDHQDLLPNFHSSFPITSRFSFSLLFLSWWFQSKRNASTSSVYVRVCVFFFWEYFLIVFECCCCDGQDETGLSPTNSEIFVSLSKLKEATTYQQLEQ